jgi:hypothetical protein
MVCLFLVVGNFSMNKDVSSWFHNVSTNSEEVIENKIFMKIQMKQIIMEFGPTLGIVRKLSIHRI